MLRLYTYLAAASALVLLIALAVIALIYRHQAREDLTALAERQNIVVDRILANSVFSPYDYHFESASDLSAEALRTSPETFELDRLVARALRDVEVLKVKVYSPHGRVLYSTETDEIGAEHEHSEAIDYVTRTGEPLSELSYEESVSAFSQEAFDRDVVETYLPRLDGRGRVAGAVEIYSDVTAAIKHIERTTIMLTLILMAVFGLVYAVLVIGIMRRAIRPIQLASARARRIGPNSGGVRLPTVAMPPEILPLVEAVNRALDRHDKALDAQRRFTADASHELLTPLALLQAELDGLDDRETAVRLREDVDAMTDMIKQLLYLAELESHGAEAMNAERSNLRELALEVASRLAPVAVRQGKEIAVTGASSAVWVQGAGRALERVLRNLVENAVRHTAVGTTVEIEVSREGAMRVSDRGPGVPADRREAVFQRFWRGEAASVAGTGLGLSIARRIVENVGGTIWVEDAKGGGACFAARFVPATEAEDAHSDRAAATV